MMQEINLSQNNSNDQKVLLIIDKKNLEPVLNFIEKLNEISSQKSDAATLKRRVVPFFMNQFYHWSVNRKLTQVVIYLKYLKTKKQSQQKKFELGDLKELFNNQDFSNPDLELYRNHARESWKVFLKDFAALSVQRNQKIKCGVTKQNYLNYIPILIEELDQMFPYDKLLSKYKLPSANPEMINTDDMIQLDSDPLYSTIKEIV
ncbi:unnamed protein product (macronuclear) [Paramecium tetraurelia]|uniref:Uncharacterized protein n=1 Tax=Paramecium tetraurelia TaxID=5888 RepID=A0CJM9_PARTE|nr:uncharacterized protein GSPATT00000708001 [Paramecium tetraurelia]CAK70996.1 unnamed protein product [Paramecium tetraurelia]|eukprot:XP_001438393.1 hypothetical protein (macronuclear) [Paramecium tetraurelia strain d4-2]